MELITVDDFIKAKLTESVHTSARRSFRGCRRRYNYIFRNFWYPTVTAKPLEFGVAFHKAMEALYNPETWHDKEVALALAAVTFNETILAQKDKYRQTVGELSEEEEADYVERSKLGLGMLHYYAKRFLPLETLKPVKVEVAFEVPIKHSDGSELWCKCDNCWKRWLETSYGRQGLADCQRDHHMSSPDAYRESICWRGLPVTSGGRVDVLFEDENGELWVGDWKTAARIVEEGKDFFLELDDQITEYCRALWSLGLPIAGFLYMEIKKGFPQEPEPLKRRYQGRLYSTNKAMEYEYESYVKIVEENDPVAFENGLYDDYLEWLKTEGVVYHYRHQQHRSQEELTIAGDNLFLEAADMVDPDLRIYPTPGRFACQFCAFQEPCMAENRGDDTHYLLTSSYEKRSYHYWEKTEPSTEGKGGQ